MNKKAPRNLCKTVYSFGNLTVLQAPLDYILGMKMDSLRDRDLEDIGAIIQYKQYKSPIKTFKLLKKLGFNVDFYVILEGFGKAYGMDWLETYFNENYEELSKLFPADAGMVQKIPFSKSIEDGIFTYRAFNKRLK